VRIKVRGGTVDHGQGSLCDSCQFSTVIRGVNLGDQIVECRNLSYDNQRVPFPVTSCSRYADRNQASLREMEEIAWVLRSDPRRGQVGFVKSSKLSDEERYVLEED
jgi:hypothetical protein